MADDGGYLVAALVTSALLVLLGAFLAFFGDPYAGVNNFMPVPTLSLLAILLVLISTGSYVFATRQAHADQVGEVSAMLSALPIGRSLILLARVITGVLFLFIVIVFVTCIVAGAVFFELLPGRDWIEFRLDWPAASLVEVLIYILLSVFLSMLSCYCLGLQRVIGAPLLRAAMGGLFTSWVLILLVSIKGFTLALGIIFAVLIGCSLLSVLAEPRHRVLTVAMTGVIVCILTAVSLFSGRYLCDTMLEAQIAGEHAPIEAELRGWIPSGTESNKYPVAKGDIEEGFLRGVSYRPVRIPNLLTTLGIVKSVRSRLPAELAVYGSSLVHWRSILFDDRLGQIVYRSWNHSLYVGPQGISSTPMENLGRFVSPVFSGPIIYDRGSSRFYVIDLDSQSLRKGMELKDRGLEPVHIFSALHDESRTCWVGLENVRAPDENRYRRNRAVLDRSGRIALLDWETLDTVGWIGHLPRPRTLFGRGLGRPRDVLDYDVQLVASGPGGRHVRTVVGSLSRQGTSLTIAVFDEDGREIATRDGPTPLPHVFWGSVLVTGKYFFESLHPPVLTLASFFTTYSFDAEATHRALFIMPNSFVAQQRDRQTSLVFQLLWALLFMLPAMLFAGFLSRRVNVDARAIGVSPWARRIWMGSAFLLGLPAYITYRLMRPKCVLMVCRECGRGRRVDHDVCHHCGNAWDPPELELPTWRVVSTPRQGPMASARAQ